MGEETVVVTGANGFICSWIVKLLLERGYNVRGTVRDPQDEYKVGHLLKLDGAKERLKLYKAELMVEGAFDEVLDGANYVIHAANPVLLQSDDPENEIIEPTIQGTLGVLEAASKSKTVKKVLYTSSTAAVYYSDKFVNKPEDEVVDESWWSDSEFCRKQSMWYHSGKTLAERAGFEYAKDKHFDFVSVLPCTVIGSILQKATNWSSNEVTRILSGIPRPEDHQKIETNISFIDVEDLAMAHILVMENPHAEGRYLAVGYSMNNDQLAVLLGQLYPDHSVLKPDLKGMDVETFLKPRLKYSVKKLQDLGWKVTPLEQCLKKSAEAAFQKQAEK